MGDFGCAAQIKAHTTMAGEIQGIVGTQGIRHVVYDLYIDIYNLITIISIHGSGSIYAHDGGRTRARC